MSLIVLQNGQLDPLASADIRTASTSPRPPSTGTVPIGVARIGSPKAAHSYRHFCAALAVAHRHGSVDNVGHALYDEVTGIHEPGRTMSLMLCGRGKRGTWDYLDPYTGRHGPAAPDLSLAARLRALTPHPSPVTELVGIMMPTTVETVPLPAAWSPDS